MSLPVVGPAHISYARGVEHPDDVTEGPLEGLQPAEGDGPSEAAYRWTIRFLYLALLAANLYVVYDAYAETVPVIELRAKIRAAVHRRLEQVRNCEGCAARKAYLKRQANRVVFAATEIVEQAAARAGSEGDEA